MILSGWGRYPRTDCAVIQPSGEAEILAAIRASDSLIARGGGRAYGDPALNARATLAMAANNRLLAFDAATGQLTCEAGVVLADIVSLFSLRGWFPPVTPGTKFVTVGGMIAADIHGKNHHKDGGFGAHIDWLDLATADGAVVRCSPTQDAEVFYATIGGMGLTGVILRAAFRLRPIETGRIWQTTLRAANLDHVLRLFERTAAWTYSVAWIDCQASGADLGRSVLFLGEHATAAQLPSSMPLYARPRPGRLRVPIDLPDITLNRWSMGAFNALYYALPRPSSAIVDADKYFYPLDSIADWNRVYGARGLLQYQCVLPKAASRDGLAAILKVVSGYGTGSFLAVLKLFGAEGPGLLSFPMEGYTLTLDFPATPANLAMLNELDAIVNAHEGRLYLAKDARASAETLARGYPRLQDFREVRARVDPRSRFGSLQSMRLGL